SAPRVRSLPVLPTSSRRGGSRCSVPRPGARGWRGPRRGRRTCGGGTGAPRARPRLGGQGRRAGGGQGGRDHTGARRGGGGTRAGPAGGGVRRGGVDRGDRGAPRGARG